MQLAAYLKLQCRELSREAFARRHPHPWLLRELTDEERSQISYDVFESVTVQTSTLHQRPTAASARMAARLYKESHRFGLLPVVKGRLNLWKERVLVGRAASCDVVLPEGSVSKVHAWLQQSDGGGWRLCDAPSANGTLVDGRRVDPAGGGVAVASGAALQFGRQRCEFIESGELFDFLVGERAPDRPACADR
jgi:hypothetical protein